jgi:hypothetical protein
MTHLMRLLAAWVVVLSLTTGGFAQSSIEDDFPGWSNFASQAETALQIDRYATASYERLRTDLVDWRARFLEAQSVNAARITTLQSQIAALGAVPAEGETEPAEVAARRAALNTQLDVLRAPVIKAEEAYTRANGLVSEIDQIVRERQTEAYFEQGPKPWDMSLYPAAISGGTGAIRLIWAEIKTAWATDETRERLVSSLPLILFYLVFAFVLILRGKGWTERLSKMIVANTSRGRGVWRFVLSLGQILLPYIGVLALREAILNTGLLGLQGTRFVSDLDNYALYIIVARWLASVLFPKAAFIRQGERSVLGLKDTDRRRLRFWISAMGFALAIVTAVFVLLNNVQASIATQTVLVFPWLLVVALILFWIGRIIVTCAPREIITEGAETPNISINRVAIFLGRAAMLVAVLSPILSIAGYSIAAAALLYPTVTSLGLIGLLVVLQRLVGDLYSLLTGAEDGDNDALIPILIGMVLSVASLPIFALMWGARTSDLTELWARFREGFTLGDSRISPTDFLTFAVVFTVIYMVTRVLQSMLRSSVLPKTKMDIGGQNAITSGVGYIGIFLAALIAITSAGIDLSNLAIVAGALSVGKWATCAISLSARPASKPLTAQTSLCPTLIWFRAPSPTIRAAILLAA